MGKSVGRADAPQGLLEGFGFDNEGPRHDVLLEPYALAERPVTCGAYLAFIKAGGYSDPSHWLSAGWDTVQREGWCAPLYWRCVTAGKSSSGASSSGRSGSDRWEVRTLDGWRPLDLDAPVCHVSFYEADAFARFSGARLPTEQEWRWPFAPSQERLRHIKTGF